MGHVSSRFPSNPEADFRTRPIASYYNDMIYLWVVSKLQIKPSDTQEEQAKKSEWQQRFADYKEKYTSIQRITYNSLPDFLHIADLTYGDMFNMFKAKADNNTKEKGKAISFGFPDARTEQFAKSCEKLPLNKRMALEEFIQELSSPSVRELTEWQGKLTVRVLTGCGLKVRQKASSIKSTLTEKKDRPKITSSNLGYFESIKIGDLPAIAQVYGLSLHWFLQLGVSVHMYSNEQCVDTILDFFCFFDAKYQQRLQQIVDDLAGRGGDNGH
jgi:hypothetical protein